MWKLLNANLNQVAKTDKNSITFGSHPSCDVKVDSCPYLLERQVFLTKFFSFSVFGSETKTHFLNTRFFIGKEKFQLNSGSLIEEFLNHRLSETELEETFSGSIYKDLLKIVQIVEGPKIYQNQLQDEELMQAISKQLASI